MYFSLAAGRGRGVKALSPAKRGGERIFAELRAVTFEFLTQGPSMSKNSEPHYSAVLAATLLFFIAAAPGFSQEARSKIRISYPNVSVCCLALFAAQQWKIFEQNGLDVEIIQMRSQAANSALASGDIHYVA